MKGGGARPRYRGTRRRAPPTHPPWPSVVLLIQREKAGRKPETRAQRRPPGGEARVAIQGFIQTAESSRPSCPPFFLIDLSMEVAIDWAASRSVGLRIPLRGRGGYLTRPQRWSRRPDSLRAGVSLARSLGKQARFVRVSVGIRRRGAKKRARVHLDPVPCLL